MGHAAQLLASGRVRRVLVIGPADAGKSSLCRVIASKTAERRLALLDADLGQKLIGPPACMTLGSLTSRKHFALHALAFVGTTDPVRGSTRVGDGLRRLATEAEADLLVINTDGLLSEPSRWLKERQIDAFAPDLIIAVGEHPTLDALARAQPILPWLWLASAPRVLRQRKHAASSDLGHVAGSASFTPARIVGQSS